MQAQRKRILQMLENGTISMDEALTLLENLQEGATKVENNSPVSETRVTTQESESKLDHPRSEQEWTDRKAENTEKDEAKFDDFLDDLRRDFTMVGDRFMQFMQSTVEKVKEIDLEAPFGKSFVFNHTVTHSMEGLEEISFAIPSGKVSVHPSEEEDLRTEFTVKAYHKEAGEEEAKQEVLDKISIINDHGSFKVTSEVKIGQVDVDVYVPNRDLKKFEARLTNGAFKATKLHVNHVQVKTTNGAIQFNDVVSKTMEAETLNGRVYIDGDMQEVNAQSLNGAVVVTTNSEEVKRIEAKTVSGAVELYIPSTISLSGTISSNVGKLDLGLTDIERVTEQEQLFQKTIRFYKEVPEQDHSLYVIGNAKTGTVLVRYNHS